MELLKIFEKKWAYFTTPVVVLSLVYVAGLLTSASVFRSLIFDITGILCIFPILFLCWLAFFAQFILPVRDWHQRFQIFFRLILHAIGFGGPAIFIRNGEPVKSSRDEENKKRCGVIWLDTASAAVLRTDTKFTRTVGPGVVFTKKGEYFAGCVDLRKQSNSIGPRPEDKPFDDPADEETKARCKQTCGLTRDGITVMPNISITFSIDAEKNKKTDPQETPSYNTRYGFNEESVRKAIQHESVNPDEPDDASSRHVKWNQLPIYLAVDVWREHIRKFTFSELFAMEKKNGLETVTAMMNERMKSPQVDELNDEGKPTGRKIESQEYRQLSDRGIKVLSVSINNLFFEESLEYDIIQGWPASWLEYAKAEGGKIDHLASLTQTHGREEALKEFATTSSRILGREPDTPDCKTALYDLLQGTKQSMMDNKVNGSVNAELRDIQEVIKWARKRL